MEKVNDRFGAIHFKRTNQSFEWIDDNANGQLDIYADGITPAEQIVDMGLRGLLPEWE